ncbi:hypothetical protein H8I91_09485 [Serratia fonticola]|uniref:hypothetical protein n=1 Tax=Serratia fonticola TaxID=47917 RepID=UPI001649391F|nr:hypothetical protein [Serratia fonticola]MBC3250494.1 hypothetical protein [Serratia fonticola]
MATNSELKEYPGGFDSLTIRELLDELVTAHVSKAMSGEKMKPAERTQDLALIKSTIVMAAHFVRSVLEEKEGKYLIGNCTAAQWAKQQSEALHEE